jgi:hypothetical protein
MATVILPPNLSDLFDLEGFLSFQRSQPLLLLRVYLLNLDCTSGKRKTLSLSLLSFDCCILSRFGSLFLFPSMTSTFFLLNMPTNDSVEELESQINTSTANQHNVKQISCAQATPNSWYEKIRFYLTHGSYPRNLDPKNRRAIRLKSTSF